VTQQSMSGLLRAMMVGLVCLTAGSCGAERAHSTELLPGCEFEVMGELYAYEVAKNLNNRKADLITIVPLRLSGPEILSSRVVPLGSRLKVIARDRDRWPSFLYPVSYFVQLDTLRSDLPIFLGLSRGNEGQTTPLNPTIYKLFKCPN
jgi:hypothetical protein